MDAHVVQLQPGWDAEIMAIDLSPDCRDDNHGKCPGYGWDMDADQADVCPCTCHPDTPKCGQPHEAPGLAHLGACLAGENHSGPHVFNGPIDGTVITVTLGDGWTRERTEDRPERLLEPGLNAALEDLGRALGKARGPHEPPEAVAP